MFTETSVNLLLGGRSADANKGDFGHVLIVGGSRGMAGAPYLAAMGALRCGAGLVTAAAPKNVWKTLAVKLTEAMTLPLTEDPNGAVCKGSVSELSFIMPKITVAALGCGLSCGKEQQAFVFEFLKNGSCPVIIDADGLNCVAKDVFILKHIDRPVIITPHPGEMSRLTGKTVESIQAERERSAASFAEQFGCIVVLKGANTVVATPQGEVFINKTGNPSMAKGGCGDLLTGMIAGFYASQKDAFKAACLGVHYHGRAADLLLNRFSEHAVLATDILNELPSALIR